MAVASISKREFSRRVVLLLRVRSGGLPGSCVCALIGLRRRLHDHLRDVLHDEGRVVGVAALHRAVDLCGWLQDDCYPQSTRGTCLSREASMLAIALRDDVEQRLDALAKATGRSKESYLQEAIVEYLGDRGDFYLAEQRLADIRTGSAGTVSLVDIGRDLGLAN